MVVSRADSALARYSVRTRSGAVRGALPTHVVDTPVGRVRVHDSATAGPCVLIAPDGPNVIEHYEVLIGLLSHRVRVVCFEMPGFGYSIPESSYSHSLDEGATAILGVLDGLDISTATLAFSCANGLYALRAAQAAPERTSSLVLSQTPSLGAMHTWTDRVIPRPLRARGLGQLAGWLFRRKIAHDWYRVALPRATDPTQFQQKALDALSRGACFCLAGVVQGLVREQESSIQGVTTACTMIWGDQDHSHKHTDPAALHDCVPHAEIVHFEDCGHFPDIEQPERFAGILLERVARHAIQPA
jgi:pimeloyl-ACP methyl ester carboxylesterase